MGGAMPYYLEKGVTLRLIEQHLNGDREWMLSRLEQLRTATSPQWVKEVLPDLWSDPGFDVRTSSAEHVLEDWFGMPSRGASAEPQDEGRPGYWIGYHGNVEEIVRQAFIRALDLAVAGPEPDAIELFWSCAAPWFEAWVVRRPVDLRPLAGDPDGEAVGEERGRGLVTIYFHTPSHRGASVSETPVAADDAVDALHRPNGTPRPHPIPSLEVDYEHFGEEWAHGLVMGGHRPRKPATQRRFATWVVTHRRHELHEHATASSSTTAPSGFGDWDVPQLSVYRGTGDVVTVSPSLRAGGITYNGRIVPEKLAGFAASEAPAPAGGEV